MTLPKKLAFLDIETTGLRMSYDRIIEIGILRAEADDKNPRKYKLTNTYKSLINPNGYLSPEITYLTGITSEELENAPTFRQIKDEILEMLADCILVAHNVRFDYGFLKQEFKRLNFSFSTKHFCTVKLTRNLFPNLGSYNLDSLIQNFNLKCKNRHRAFDDAKVLWDFYNQIALKRVSQDLLIKALNIGLRRPSVPLKISQEVLDDLPEAPGVYIFYGSNSAVLYIGKSINIKDRVLSHFSNDTTSPIEMKISQQIESIEAIKTTGELGALLLESSLIKKMQPLYNRMLRQKRKLVLLKQVKDKFGFETVSMEVTDSIDVGDVDKVMGVFRSVKNAKDFLISTAKQYNLCEKILGVEKTTNACFGYRLNKCSGACVNKESLLKYNLRFLTAFTGLKFQSWPFEGPILIEEKDFDNKKEVFIVDRWCFLGSVKKTTDKSVNDLLNQEYSFDLDTYKILHRFLNSRKDLKNFRAVQLDKKVDLNNLNQEEFFVSP